MSLPSKHPLGPPLGTSGDLSRRILLHHLPFAAIGALLIALFNNAPQFDIRNPPRVDLRSGAAPRLAETSAEPAQIPPQRNRRDSTRQVTVATGYVGLGFIALTLIVGPVNLLLRRQNPISSHFRRDLGIWAAIFSVVHVGLGFHVYGGGRPGHVIRYFIAAEGRPLTNSFGWGNWTGGAAWLIAVLLLITSNDLMLQQLKSDRWKGIQRLNYALFILVIAHAFFYGAGLRLESPFTVLLGLSMLFVGAAQVAGFGFRFRK